jgi:putative membrane protein
MINALFAFLHFAAAFAIVFCLAVEMVTLKQTMTAGEMRRLQRVDLVYGLAAASVLVAGLLRVFFFEKGSAFYLSQPFFYVKFAAFIFIGLLSIYPTVQFIRWGRLASGQQNFAPPAGAYQKARQIVRLEVALIALVVLSATLMARAVGM